MEKHLALSRQNINICIGDYMEPGTDVNVGEAGDVAMEDPIVAAKKDMDRIKSEMNEEKYAISYFIFEDYGDRKKKIEATKNQMDWNYWLSEIENSAGTLGLKWSSIYIYGMKEGDEQPKRLVEIGFVKDGRTQAGAIENVHRCDKPSDGNSIFGNDVYESLEAAAMAVLSGAR